MWYTDGPQLVERRLYLGTVAIKANSIQSARGQNNLSSFCVKNIQLEKFTVEGEKAGAH
jgi:hypothetical protein